MAVTIVRLDGDNVSSIAYHQKSRLLEIRTPESLEFVRLPNSGFVVSYRAKTITFRGNRVLQLQFGTEIAMSLLADQIRPDSDEATRIK